MYESELRLETLLPALLCASRDLVEAVQAFGLVTIRPCILIMNLTLQWLSMSPSTKVIPCQLQDLSLQAVQALDC